MQRQESNPVSAMDVPAELLQRIRQIWESARGQAARSVNTAHVCANWLIGQQIVEAEQGGRARAEYGKSLLKTLSRQLSAEYGAGFSVSALKYMRLFFLSYRELLPKSHALRGLFGSEVQHAPHEGFVAAGEWKPGILHSGLAWTHYPLSASSVLKTPPT